MQSVYFLAFLLAMCVCMTIAKHGRPGKLAKDYIGASKNRQDHHNGGAPADHHLPRLHPKFQDIEHLEKDLDKNENGLVEEKEVEKLLKGKFQKADFNRDGKLNEEELKMFRSEAKDEVETDDMAANRILRMLKNV